jgi:peptide/nickel transport system substrate-binding protein
MVNFREDKMSNLVTKMGKRSRHSVWLRRLAFIAGALISLAAMLPHNAGAATPPDVLVVATNLAEVESLDPQDTSAAAAIDIGFQLYDRLYELNPFDPSKLEPAVAESFTVSDDRLTYTFHIRHGIKFHSGNPLTAQDVQYSFRRLIHLNLEASSGMKSWGFTADKIDNQVVALDDYTVKIIVDKPYAPSLFLQIMANPELAIVDSKVLQSHEANGDWGNKWLRQTSAGSGAYSVSGYTRNQTVALQANERYWRFKPGVKRLLFRHVGESGGQRLLLEKGDIDVAMQVSASDLAGLQGNANVSIKTVDRCQFYFITLNQLDKQLTDPRIWEGFRWLIDYKGLAATTMKGWGTPSQTFIPHGLLGSSADLPFHQDIAKAKSLFDAAGAGGNLKRDLLIPNQFPFTDIAQSLQYAAHQAGVELNVIQQAPAELYGKNEKRDYSILLGRMTDCYPDPDATAQEFMFNPDNSQNANWTDMRAWRAAWYDPSVNALVAAGRVEDNIEARRHIYESLQDKSRHSPVIILFQGEFTVATRSNVKNLGIHGYGVTYGTVTKQ